MARDRAGHLQERRGRDDGKRHRRHGVERDDEGNAQPDEPAQASEHLHRQRHRQRRQDERIAPRRKQRVPQHHRHESNRAGRKQDEQHPIVPQGALEPARIIAPQEWILGHVLGREEQGRPDEKCSGPDQRGRLHAGRHQIALQEAVERRLSDRPRLRDLSA